MSQGKVALVTGVSSGIGRAIAGLLSRQGFGVFGTARANGGVNRALENVELVHVDVRNQRRGCLPVKCCWIFEEPIEERHGTRTTSLFAIRVHIKVRRQKGNRDLKSSVITDRDLKLIGF